MSTAIRLMSLFSAPLLLLIKEVFQLKPVYISSLTSHNYLWGLILYQSQRNLNEDWTLLLVWLCLCKWEEIPWFRLNSNKIGNVCIMYHDMYWDLCILDAAEVVIYFNPLWTHFLLLFTTVYILQHIVTITEDCYYISVKNLLLTYISWFSYL